VLDAMKELQYRPSRAAVSLSVGRTRSIVVLVPFLTRPSSVARLSGIIAMLDEQGYDCIVRNVETAEQRDRHLESVLREHRADGVIVASLPLDRSTVAALQDAQVPLAMVDADTPGVVRTVLDDVLGGRLACESLLARGHERIGFIGDNLSDGLGFTSTRRRLRGYRDALESVGSEYDPSLVRLVSHGAKPAFGAAVELLERADAPTAIVAASDTQAIGVLQAAEACARRVPDELAIIGYDDIETAELLALSSVRQPIFASGVNAAERLCALIAGVLPTPKRVLMSVEVVERSSTGNGDWADGAAARSASRTSHPASPLPTGP
jgi:LacI family transcriptional regulator/LacI family repressor for deo operon, udp, cdd, tsx, nupC, and nupG